jgi:hypothetical protein
VKQDNYTRVSCFDSTTTWSAAHVGENYSSTAYTSSISSNPANAGGTVECKTGRGSSVRSRVLFDYGTDNSSTATFPVPSTCTAAGNTKECLEVVGRGMPGTGGPGSTLSAWDTGSTGTSYSGSSGDFDQWAMKVNPNADPIPLTRDCGAPADNLSSNDRRSWEITGFNPNEAGVQEREAFFKAWDGGSGQNDCSTLYRQMDAQGDSWGAFLAYSFGPGATSNMTNPN